MVLSLRFTPFFSVGTGHALVLLMGLVVGRPESDVIEMSRPFFGFVMDGGEIVLLIGEARAGACRLRRLIFDVAMGCRLGNFFVVVVVLR